MPISPEKLALYPPDWPAIRERIRQRAGNCCEWCKVPNHVVVWRGTFGQLAVYEEEEFPGQLFHADTGELIARGDKYSIQGDSDARRVRIVCTCAHVNDPDPGNCADDNLAFLCQRCHNRHDAPMRRQNAHNTRRARRALRDLFDPL